MAQHLLSALRKRVLSAALWCLPARRATPVMPKPRRRSQSVQERTDPWLFEASMDITTVQTAFSRELDGAASSLADLRSLLGRITDEAPLGAIGRLKPKQHPIEDEFLFDVVSPVRAAPVPVYDAVDEFFDEDDGVSPNYGMPFPAYVPHRSLNMTPRI